MATLKLTKSIIDVSIYQGETYVGRGGKTEYKRFVIWDSEIPGLGLRITPKGRKVFVVQYRTQGRQRLMAIGKYGVLTLKQARDKARTLLVAVLEGGDPLAEREGARKDPLIAELAARYLEEHAQPKKKPASVKMDASMLERFILPALGRLKLRAVTRRDVADLHHSLRKKPHTANRVLSLLSTMFKLAELWGWRPDGTNPAKGVERYKEPKRERYASNEELGRLADALATSEAEGLESPHVVAAIRLLLFTGCRTREILKARWEDVDLAARKLRLPDSKTGARDVRLAAPALEVIAGIPRTVGYEHLIEGAKPGIARYNIDAPWARICERAVIKNLRMHDLRHTYASVAVGGGQGLPVVGRLLGHKSQATTARYAHVAPDPADQAAEAVAAEIKAAMQGGEGAEVVPIGQGKQ